MAAILKTATSFVWDIKMDWGLGDARAGYLRAQLSYSAWIYYVAIVFNFFGRISWSLGISSHFCDSSCMLLLGVLEILRRAVWVSESLRPVCVCARGVIARERETERNAGVFLH